MDFRILDLNNVSEQELLDCINKNIIVAKMYREEIARLKQLSTLGTKQVIVRQNQRIEVEDISPISSKDEDFEDEVDYYYEAIHNLTTISLIDNLEDFLPSKKHPYYEKLMHRLQAEILREIKEVKDFIGGEDLSLEEVEELRSEIALSQQKIDKIKSLLATKKVEEEKETTTEEENKLIFVPTQTGRIRVFDELESMPPEYYDELADLFSSIKNGTFKGAKRFHGELYGRTSEVKGKLMRVVFDRIDKNAYAILTMFAKKFDTSSAYRTSLETTIQSYLPMRDSIMENLASEEFLELHKNLELDLMRRLSPAKENVQVKAKEVSHG